MEKQYVRVNGNWEDDGSFIPLFILWENGLKYKIEKIVQRCPAASLKSGGAGLRYTCLLYTSRCV